MSGVSNGGKKPKTAWLVFFYDTLYRAHSELEVFPSRELARRAARERLDPGWRSHVCHVYLDEWRESYSEPPLPVDDDE